MESRIVRTVNDAATHVSRPSLSNRRNLMLVAAAGILAFSLSLGAVADETPVATLATATSYRSVAAAARAVSQTPAATPLQTAVWQPTLPKRNWFKRFFFKPTWEQALAECATPKDVCRMVEKHVGYREQALDQWTPGRKVWDRGYGTCQHFAVLIQQICRERGFETSIHLYYPLAMNAPGHAVVVGECNGRIWVSSNGDYSEVKSRDEVTKQVAQFLFLAPERVISVPVADSEVDRLTSGDSLVAATTVSRSPRL